MAIGTRLPNEEDFDILRIFEKARDKVFNFKNVQGKSIFEVLKESDEFKNAMNADYKKELMYKQQAGASHPEDEGEQIGSLTEDNMREQALQTVMEDHLWDLIESQIDDMLKSDEYAGLADKYGWDEYSMGYGKKENDGFSYKDLIENAMINKLNADPPPVMPEKLYRGDIYNGQYYIKGDIVGYNPEVDGFGRKDLSKQRDLYNSFVTTVPEVAASYHRRHPYDRTQVNTPTSLGDYIYEIYTKGLDPALFERDNTSTLSEALFGPQFIYRDKIPQEDVEIIDSAGNTRIVPRIQKMHYGSDRRLKRVITPRKEIINAIRTRF